MPQWEVVGGADKGGILVREGKDLNTTQHTNRLSTGALVEELTRAGERVHYKLLTGSGPDEGWVSLKMSGKELLVAAQKVEVPANGAAWPAQMKAALAAEPTPSGNLKEAAPVLRPVGKAVAKARLRMLLFNWTGNRGGAGSSHQFLQWTKALAEQCPSDTWEVLEAAYPGRGTRQKDPCATEAKEIASSVVEALKKANGPAPIVLFGFSFGAIIAYETAVLLSSCGTPVLGLIAASAEHPGWPGRKLGAGAGGSPTKSLKMEAFEQILHEKGGTEMILQNPDLKKLYVPVIFSDMIMEEAYGESPPSHPPLPCPIVAFRGKGCPQVRREDVEGWLDLSSCKEGTPTCVEEVATDLEPTKEMPWLSDWYLCQGVPSAQAMLSTIAKTFGGAS